ncbi:MAG TPA: porin [Roseiarcus sp.]|nr:porin [Roseiarcus sp.]
MRFAPRLLGSIVVAASAGAEAADFSADRAAPVDYVKACNVGGMAGFVLPGGDACLRISGYVTGGIAAGDLKGLNWTFAPGAAAAAYSFRARAPPWAR